MDYDGKTNWNKFADIISFEQGNKKYKLVLKFVSDGKEIEFFANVI